MNTRLMLPALGLIGLVAVPADASDFYAGAGSGGYRLEADEFKDTAATMKFMGGYRLNEHVAFEGSYRQLFEAKDSLGGSPVEIDGSLWEASTVLSYPFAQRFQGYSRLGWTYSDLSLKSQGIAGPFRLNDYDDNFSWAIGGSYDVNDRIGLRSEYGQLDIDDADAEFLSIDLTYRFGQ